MVETIAREAAALVARALTERQCDSLRDLMIQSEVRTGAALLARLGYPGNAEAAWESLAEATALALLPDDPIAALVVDWSPHPEALREFGERALLAGVAPLAPALAAEAKMRLLSRLSRPSQVAFETYALAREVATHVVAQLRS
jgi:hypothetical protein